MYIELRSLPVSSFRVLGFFAVSVTIALGGCSASITRFDNPSFALGEGGADSTSTSRSSSSPDAPVRPIASQPASYQAAPARGGPVEVAGLPSINNQSVPTDSPAPRAMAVTRQAAAPIAAQPVSAPVVPASVAKGQQIEVQQGDTLYGIAKRHKVLISDLMAVNELRNPSIKPGQKLYLPVGGEGRATPKVKPERIAALAPQAERPTAVAAPVVAAEESAGGYTVKPGDSLYAIAARHHVKVLELQRVNNIKDVSKVKPGTVLRIPSGAAIAATPPTHAGSEKAHSETRIVRVNPPMSPSVAPAGVKVLNGTQTASASTGVMADAGPIVPPAIQSAKLRWPVKGRVLYGFGPRPDGSQNDGVDISVPVGTDVLAAEDGVVAYAGNEVKTYGNLVLIRHDNGWVTAYAYNDKLLVQRGDRVTRGQAVAKVGKTGSADQPLLHFEVRVGSKPVDPSGYLEKL